MTANTRQPMAAGVGTARPHNLTTSGMPLVGRVSSRGGPRHLTGFPQIKLNQDQSSLFKVIQAEKFMMHDHSSHLSHSSHISHLSRRPAAPKRSEGGSKAKADSNLRKPLKRTQKDRK